MEVTDLMLGDWIEDGYKKAQVTSITCDGIVETTAAISNIEVVDPIPLTEEILVKNGFRIQVVHDNGKWLWITDNSWLAYSERHDYWYYEDVKITYVHQLQHLLRLAGVQKEIEL